jgi:hypothetical protein
VFGALVAVAALPVDAVAAIISTVPEIDGGSMATALGVLTGGVLIVRAYWRSK